MLIFFLLERPAALECCQWRDLATAPGFWRNFTSLHFTSLHLDGFRVMLRSLFCRPGLARGFGLVGQRGEVVLEAAHGRGDRNRTGGVRILWAPLPIAVVAAGREEEEGQWKTLPQGYNWENSVTAKGGVRWFVRPSQEKAAGAKKNQIQILSASQLLLLHKENCFTDLRPEHLSKSKDRIQGKKQEVEQQQEQVEKQPEQVEEQQEQVDSAKKRALDARKKKELNDKRARLDTYGQQFDQRYFLVL
jgi:hypothetical protein